MQRAGQALTPLQSPSSQASVPGSLGQSHCTVSDAAAVSKGETDPALLYCRDVFTFSLLQPVRNVICNLYPAVSL